MGAYAVLTCTAKLLRGKQSVHRARAKAFQVEGDKFESELFEDHRELGSHGGVKRTVEFTARNLDTNDVSVMAHAELAETECADCVFAALNYFERFAGDRASILDTG